MGVVRTATDGRTFVCMQPAVATWHLWIVVPQYRPTPVGHWCQHFQFFRDGGISGKVEY